MQAEDYKVFSDVQTPFKKFKVQFALRYIP